MDNQILDSMMCPICFELAEKAVETSCCHHVFCEHCLSLVGKNCPQCRKQFSMEISHISRRIIGNLPAACSFHGCKAKVSKSELKDHEANCELRLFNCPAAKCLYEGLKRDYAIHLAIEHQDSVTKNAAKLFDASSQPSHANINEDRVASTKNEAGYDCRLGATGKFFCRMPLNGPRCSCCNGYCGPTNGCNCGACMKLDVKSRMLPRHWYVNRDGFSCRISSETGHMYCGRKVMGESSRCDGYCGPTNGPNCESCRILHCQLGNRYKDIWR